MKLRVGKFGHLRVRSTKSKLARRKSEEEKESSNTMLFRNRGK